MDSSNLWSRRSQNTRLSLSTGNAAANGTASSNEYPTPSSTVRRNGGGLSSHSTRANPFNSTALASPTAGASSAFGLGSGAFASFGSSKTPKTPGTALDFGSALGMSAKTHVAERSTKELEEKLADASLEDSDKSKRTADDFKKLKLRYTWVFWVRPPVQKTGTFVEYEKTLHSLLKFNNVNDFGLAFKSQKRPSSLPVVTDKHLFKEGIRPIWEDDDNKSGGKWELRLKKGIADRYWEETQFALIGDMFDDSEEICGAVISMRNGEDILSMWLRNDNNKNVRIREQWKKFLNCPPNTTIEWKSHDSSLQNRATLDQFRSEKYHNIQQQASPTRNGVRDEISGSSDKKQAS